MVESYQKIETRKRVYLIFMRFSFSPCVFQTRALDFRAFFRILVWKITQKRVLGRTLVCLTEMVKRHIYGPRPFIWAYDQVSMTFRSKVIARTRKRWQTDGQTDGRTPQLYRPPTCGLWPNKEVFVKHEQAPNRPQTRRGMVSFVDFKYILYENRYFWQICFGLYKKYDGQIDRWTDTPNSYRPQPFGLWPKN